MEENKKQQQVNVIEKISNVISKLLVLFIFLVMIVIVFIVADLSGLTAIFKKKNIAGEKSFSSTSIADKKNKLPGKIEDVWVAPDTATIANEVNKEAIRYGYSLISNTAYYLGPKGKVAHISNGMNCQNCHLNAGTKPFGNNLSAVAATYPKFKERSGSLESICRRVNDCFERSLNGKSLDSSSKEMQGIIAYIKWLGNKVPKGTRPTGAGITDLAYMSRAANAENGKKLYLQKCMSCHTESGAGKLSTDSIAWQYPPLWGEHSYTIGAGLYRLSRFAGYIKSNMPLGTTYDNPQLSDEEAWDISAFINSQVRPALNVSKDWPNKLLKPIDYPFGPYADTFSEAQHKYGPFEPMKRQGKIK